VQDFKLKMDLTKDFTTEFQNNQLKETNVNDRNEKECCLMKKKVKNPSKSTVYFDLLKNMLQMEKTTTSSKEFSKLDILKEMVHRLQDNDACYRAGYNACLVDLTRQLMMNNLVDCHTKSNLLTNIAKLSKQNIFQRSPPSSTVSSPLVSPTWSENKDWPINNDKSKQLPINNEKNKDWPMNNIKNKDSPVEASVIEKNKLENVSEIPMMEILAKVKATTDDRQPLTKIENVKQVQKRKALDEKESSKKNKQRKNKIETKQADQNHDSFLQKCSIIRQNSIRNITKPSPIILPQEPKNNLPSLKPIHPRYLLPKTPTNLSKSADSTTSRLTSIYIPVVTRLPSKQNIQADESVSCLKEQIFCYPYHHNTNTAINTLPPVSIFL